MSKEEDLTKRIAYLESVNDQLITEIAYTDHLMHVIGFNRGLAGLKVTAEEMLSKGAQQDNDQDPEGKNFPETENDKDQDSAGIF